MEIQLNTNQDEPGTPKKTAFENLSLDSRRKHADDLMRQHPGRIAIVLEKHKSATLNISENKKMYNIIFQWH